MLRLGAEPRQAELQAVPSPWVLDLATHWDRACEPLESERQGHQPVDDGIHPVLDRRIPQAGFLDLSETSNGASLFFGKIV